MSSYGCHSQTINCSLFYMQLVKDNLMFTKYAWYVTF